jgi:ligand-binding sensor domain-containing protein/signal transduction histidine kinase
MQHRSNGHRGRPAACRSVRRSVRSDAALGWLFTALVWIAAVSSAAALERDRAMSQYIRDDWGSARGYPGGAVHAIAQSRDGYLWIAAERGLVRFDGVKFELIEVSSAATGGGTSILGVAADPDGGILARPAGPALFTIKDGVQGELLARHKLTASAVTAMAGGRDGAVLTFSTRNGLLHYHRGRFTKIGDDSQLPDRVVLAMAQASDGSWWLGTRDGGIFQLHNGNLTPVDAGLADVKINCLAAGPRGEIWVGTDSGVMKFADGLAQRVPLPASASPARVLGMTRDRDDNIWIAAGAHGLLRVSADGRISHAPWDWRVSGSVTAVFEDREGNLWLGTSKGIERWRDGVFTAFAGVHLPTDRVGPIHVDQAQRTWFAPAAGGLNWLRGDEVSVVPLPGLADDVVYSIASSGDDIWVGRQRGGLTRFHDDGVRFTSHTFTRRDGLPQDSVYAVHAARDGAIWVGTLSGGISRYSGGVFTTFTTANGLAANTITAIDDGPDGSLWLGTPSGISRLRPNKPWRTYTAADGLPEAEVQTLFVDSTGDVWVGTRAGLAVIRRGRVLVRNKPAALAGSILGLVEDREGWLWLTTSNRVLRVRRDRLADDAAGPEHIYDYDTADGLISREGVERHRTVVADRRGHVWLVVNGAIQSVDPRRSARDLPALMSVEAVTADDRVVPPAGLYEIPAGTQRVTFSYAGLSLAVPERVRYRYVLHGFDRGWSRDVTARQAVYTNLPPGSYTFRVMSSNGDGIWNSAPAIVSIHVAPMFWQTSWFHAGVTLLIVVGGVSTYRFRLRQIARRLNDRFEERLAERTRLAQELHDTLLQGVLSTSMQLHLAIDRVPEEAPARASLEHVRSLMGRVIDEGRHAVRGLRARGVDDDLERAFAQVPRDFGAPAAAACRIAVQGSPRPIHPLIRDEIYRIGREALVNALRHSGASEIELEVDYQASHVSVTVRDDGHGIDEQVLRVGRTDHWGLLGMQERAEGIGARLRVWTRRDKGTEVELTVPGVVAFTRSARLAWWRAWPVWRAFRRGAMPSRAERK